MPNLSVYPREDSLEKLKDKVSAAKPTDKLYIHGYPVGKVVGKLKGILDTLQEHLNSKYEQEDFTYTFCLLFSIQFL